MVYSFPNKAKTKYSHVDIATAPRDLPKITKMSSNCDNKPDLTLSPQVRKLLELENQFTVGGFEPLPYFFEKAQGSLLWVSGVKKDGNCMWLR